MILASCIIPSNSIPQAGCDGRSGSVGRGAFLAPFGMAAIDIGRVQLLELILDEIVSIGGGHVLEHPVQEGFRCRGLVNDGPLPVVVLQRHQQLFAYFSLMLDYSHVPRISSPDSKSMPSFGRLDFFISTSLISDGLFASV
jgi:hypothetical protein